VDAYVDICADCPYRRREMLQVSTATGAAGLPDCNRRNICPKAAKRKRQRRDERLAQAEWRVKFELTMPPELRMVTPQTIKMQSAMLAKLQRALKRAWIIPLCLEPRAESW
jgi:hypothetical protein